MDREQKRLLAAQSLLVAAAMVCFVLAYVTKSPAHDAPMGWQYPLSCCSNRDCRQTAQREVRETEAGYLLVSTGEVVPYGNGRIKDSPDGLFHVCQQAGNFETGRVLCLFVPPRGF